jgi:hypothetical protein
MILNHRFPITWGFVILSVCHTTRQRKRSIIDTIFRCHEVPSPDPSAPWLVQPLHRPGSLSSADSAPGLSLTERRLS